MRPIRPWKVEPALTSQQLERLRNEFWETRVEGRKEMWEALRFAAEADSVCYHSDSVTRKCPCHFEVALINTSACSLSFFIFVQKKNRRNFVMRPSKQRAYVPRTVAQRYNPCLMSEVHYTRFPCMRCSLLLIWTSSPQLQSSKMPRVLWLIISMRMSARVREQIARRKLSFSDHSLFVLRVAYYKPNFSWLLGLK